MNGRPYTAADLATLRRLYPDTPTNALAKTMARSVRAVYGPGQPRLVNGRDTRG
jgi:hypothetical protein